MGQMSNNKAKHGADNKTTRKVATKTVKENQIKNSIIGSFDDTDIKNKQNEKATKKSHKWVKIFVTILIIISLVLGVIFGRYLHKSGGSLTNAIMNIAKDVMGDQDPVFILVMGVSEDISVELTDTIILMGYNPDTNQAFMLSIPRDTFVGNNEAYAGGYDKINALYQSSPEKTVQAVEDLTGINIDYYVTVKTGALVQIVDIIGGVEFDVPMDMDYDDPSQELYIHLKKGPQKLNGDQAEQLVRFRHNNNGSSYSSEYGDNDIGRMKTQREFIKVLGEQLLATNDKDKLKEIAKTIFDNLSTDMPLTVALKYIPYVMDFDMENNLEMGQLPGGSAMLNELSFYRSNTSQTKELMDSYIEKLGLTEEEKAKYIKPIKQRASYGGGSSSKNTETNTQTNTQTNTTVNNTVNNTSNSSNNTPSGNTNSNEVTVDPTPGGGSENPGSGSENPGGGSENPGGGSENPGGGSENPGGGSENPGGGSENPGGGSENPGGGSENPGGGETPDTGSGE